MNYSNKEYIRLNRKIKNWEWFSDVNTTYFFIYCLLTANWKDDSFHGIDIKRGQFIRTLENISRETGLSIQNIRTAVKHLISTQELTQSRHGKYRIFTVVKYDYYQTPNTESNNELTRNQHESNTKVTQSKEDKKIRSKEVKNNNKPPLSPFGEMIEESEISELLKNKLNEWLKYKAEKKQSYKTTGFKTLLNQVKAAEEKAGAEAVAECFDNSMKNSWQGVFFDKLKPKEQTSFNMEQFLRRYDE